MGFGFQIIRKTYLVAAMMSVLSACGSKNTIDLAVNIGVPVKSRSVADLSKSLMSLMSISPGVSCYQRNLRIAVYDPAVDQIITMKPVVLGTNLSGANTLTYSDTGTSVDLTINHLILNSFLDEPLSITIPSDRPVEIALVGAFFQPTDANMDGVCDETNVALPINFMISKGSLAIQRNNHTTTLLGDGSVLAVGGSDGTADTTVIEKYNPVTGLWTTSAAALATGRSYHTANLLPDGKVLIAGGENNWTVLNGMQKFDPAGNSGAGALTAAANMPIAVFGHTATVLSSGDVLFIGGCLTPSSATNAVYLYNPSSDTWSTLASLLSARCHHTATLLPNGTLVVAGGTNDGTYGMISVEIYDPSGAGSTANTVPLSVPRVMHKDVLLKDGRVMITGGVDGTVFHATNEIFDANTATWSMGGTFPGSVGRYSHSVTLLPSGKVLVAGGRISNTSGSMSTGAIDIYDPVTGWSTLPNLLNVPRFGHTAELLRDGHVLIAGGADVSWNELNRTEQIGVFHPGLKSTSLFGHAPVDSVAIANHSLNLSIDVLHANPIPAYALTSPRHKDWVQMWGYVNVTGGSAILVGANYLVNQPAAAYFHPLNTTGTMSGNLYYIPHIFPMTLHFKYMGNASGCTNTSSPIPCAGTYTGTITGAGSSITLTRVPENYSSANPPPATITGVFNVTTY